MKNILLKKGAMILSLSIAASSLFMGVNAFAQEKKNEDFDKGVKIVASGFVSAGDENQTIEDLIKVIDLDGGNVEEGRLVQVDLSDFYANFVKDGLISQAEADKLVEVEKAVEKLYNELDLSKCKTDKEVQAAYEKLTEKAQNLRKSVADIEKKIGFDSNIMEFGNVEVVENGQAGEIINLIKNGTFSEFSK